MARLRAARQNHWWTFSIAAAGLITLFLAAGTPIPLFHTYRDTTSITDADLALTTAAYLGATALTLLILGRLSDHLGRKPVAVVTVLLGATGCIILTQVEGPMSLLIGRLFQGLACGLGSTALGAFVVDSAPPTSGSLAALITGNAPPFAIPLGALLSGAAMSHFLAGTVIGQTPGLVYGVVAAVLIILAVLLTTCPDTVKPRRGAWASLRPRVSIPPGMGKLVFAGGSVFATTWSLGSFFQAFSASATADYLGSTDPFIIAIVFSSGVLLTPVGAAVTGKIPARIGMRNGIIGFALAVIVLVIAVQLGSIVLFLVAGLLAGFAQGPAQTGGMRSMLSAARPEDRAGLLSTVYLICYSSAAIPALIAGQVAHYQPVSTIAIGYGALVCFLAVISLVAQARHRD